MSGLQRWSGREARALRAALRMSVRVFAAHLGVSNRTVSKWEAAGEQLTPLPDTQAVLDTALEQADAAAQERFHDSLSALRASLALHVPSLEPDLIQRPDEVEALVSILREAVSADGIKVVAVCGPGGFGKTTLATQMCHEPRLVELFNEILWVETGEDCTAARVVELVSDLCVHLDGTRPALTDPEQAGFHLARVLDVRRTLLVIDNVWSAADLAPFLLGGPECVRLVTTRNVRVCPSTTRIMRLGPMSPNDISELLRRNISPLARNEAARLAELCGGWPLLANVVGANVGQDVAAGALPSRAAVAAGEALRSYGPQAFDVWDADQRRNAIGQAIMSSIDSLDDHVVISEGSGLRDRYLSLAIFPAATPVPLSVLSQWWQTAHGWNLSAVRHFCRALADRSLISAYLADRDVIMLHDVFRAYLRHLVGGDWPALHKSLVEAYRPIVDGRWEDSSDEHEYIQLHLSYHLNAAGLDDELVKVLSSASFVVNKVMRLGHQSLIADRTVLDSLHSAAQAEYPLHSDWVTARALTGAGYLLHNLVTAADMATTMTVALLRTSTEPTVIDSLRQISDQTDDGFDVGWVRGGPAVPDEVSPGHVGAVVGVAACGNLVVSVGEDGVVRLWDLATRRHIRSYRGHVGWVFATAISPDREIIASAGEDRVIRLWRTDAGGPVGVLSGHTRRVRSLAFSANGRLVSGAEDGRILVWDIERLSLLREMDTPGCPLWSVAVGCADTVVAAGGEDEFVRLFDLSTGQLLAEQAAHRDWVRCVAFASDAPLLVSASGDRTVLLWIAASGRLAPIRRIDVSEARIRSVAVTEKADLVIASTESATIHAFTVDGSAGRAEPPPGVDWIRSVALAEDGTIIAGCEDGAVRLWRADSGDQLALLCSGANTVWSTQFAAAGELAVLGHGNGLIEVWDAVTAESRRRLRAAAGRVWSLAGNRHHVAAASGDGLVRVWSLRDEGGRLTFNDDQVRTWSVAVAPEAEHLAASTGTGHVRLWDLRSGELRWERDAHAGRVRSIAFDDGGDLLAACGGDGVVRVWHAPTGDPVTEFANPAGWARTVALDPSGKRLAVGSGTGEVYVRDIAADEFVAHLPGHTGRVLMVGFTQDPDRLVSAAADGTVRIWSLAEQHQVAEVRVDASLQCAAFDPLTGRLLAGSAAGVAMLTIKSAAPRRAGVAAHG
ncbi:MAG: NB-ARC domain-containing protein [Pseudonocardiales bacterium]